MSDEEFDNVSKTQEWQSGLRCKLAKHCNGSTDWRILFRER